MPNDAAQEEKTMSPKPLLIIAATATLTLAGCNSNQPAGTGDSAGNNSDSVDAGGAGDAGNVQAPTLGQSKPVNAAEDAASAAVGLGAAVLANNAETYVPNAAISDMYEIESSKLAEQKATSPAIKAFAKQMIADHTATTAKLKATLKTAKLDITPPSALDSRRQGMIDNLKAASAGDFDKAYLDQQTSAHREAITLHSGYAEDGENAPLKALATSAVPIIRHHLEMVQKIDQSGADGR
jgi:putative membrane protein